MWQCDMWQSPASLKRNVIHSHSTPHSFLGGTHTKHRTLHHTTGFHLPTEKPPKVWICSTSTRSPKSRKRIENRIGIENQCFCSSLYLSHTHIPICSRVRLLGMCKWKCFTNVPHIPHWCPKLQPHEKHNNEKQYEKQTWDKIWYR